MNDKFRVSFEYKYPDGMHGRSGSTIAAEKEYIRDSFDNVKKLRVERIKEPKGGKE